MFIWVSGAYNITTEYSGGNMLQYHIVIPWYSFVATQGERDHNNVV